MAEQRAAGQFPWPSVLLVIALFIVLFAVLVLSGLYADVDLPGLVNLPALNAGGDDQSEVLPPQQEPTSTPQPTNTPTQTQVPSTTPTPVEISTPAPTELPSPSPEVLGWTEESARLFDKLWLWQVLADERFTSKLGCTLEDWEKPWELEDPLTAKYLSEFENCPLLSEEDSSRLMTVIFPVKYWGRAQPDYYWSVMTLEEFPAWDRCLIFEHLYPEYGWEYLGLSREELIELKTPTLIESLGDPSYFGYCPNFDLTSQWCSDEATGGLCSDDPVLLTPVPPTPVTQPMLEWTQEEASWFDWNYLELALGSEQFRQDLGCTQAYLRTPQRHTDPLVTKYLSDFEYCPCQDEDLSGEMCIQIPIQYSQRAAESSGPYWSLLTLEEFPAWDRCLMLEHLWQPYAQDELRDRGFTTKEIEGSLVDKMVAELGDPSSEDTAYCPNFDTGSEWCSNEATGGRCNNEESE